VVAQAFAAFVFPGARLVCAVAICLVFLRNALHKFLLVSNFHKLSAFSRQLSAENGITNLTEELGIESFTVFCSSDISQPLTL
jgi:hypothetical protein